MNPDQDVDDGCSVDLAIGSVFQDEAPYLKEWIEFHKMLGVQRFVLVNDRSADGFADVLRPYVASGEAVWFDRPCPEWLQGRAWIQYQLMMTGALLDQLRGVARWLALIDIDEFLVPTESNDLIHFLRDYEDCGGLYVRWEPFGTSYVNSLSDQELLTERLRLKWRFTEGREMLGKSIVKPHRVLRPNIHRCDLLPGYRYVDSNPGMKSKLTQIRINHYWSRDEQFLFNVKLPRTARIKEWELDEQRLEYFRHLFNDVPDHSMERFTPELRRRVFGSDSGSDD